MTWDWADLLDEAVDLVDDDEVDMLKMAAALRFCSDRYPIVELSMNATQARTLATDLEELAMLRAVPPTGDAG